MQHLGHRESATISIIKHPFTRQRSLLDERHCGQLSETSLVILRGGPRGPPCLRLASSKTTRTRSARGALAEPRWAPSITVTHAQH
jgi:hypothetical protein